MPHLIYLLAVLVCPVAMGAMTLLLMMRMGNHSHSQQADPGEVARLRAEVNELSAQGGAEQFQRGAAPAE